MAGSPPQVLVAYPEEFSIAKGKPAQIRFAGELLSMRNDLATIGVFDAHTHKEVKKIKYKSGQYPVIRETCESWYNGCNFSQSLKLPTQDLEGGLYYAFLTDSSGAQSTPVYFHIRPTAEDLKSADVIILLSEPTWHAYNFYGGGSLYGIQRLAEDGTVKIGQNLSSRLYAASMRRPLLSDPSGKRQEFRTPQQVVDFFDDVQNKDLGSPGYDPDRSTAWIRTSPESNLLFSRLLRSSGISTKTVSMMDLDYDPSMLPEQSILLISGHNEYWTQSMIKGVEDFVARGGRTANFSGNLMWWQINIVGGTIFQDQIGHERSDRCADFMPAPFRETGYRHLLSGSGPEKLFGVNYRFANFPLDSIVTHSDEELREVYGVARDSVDLGRTQGIRITVPDHPIFEGMNFNVGDIFAADRNLLAVELDGAPLLEDGTLDRRLPNDFPNELSILGTGASFVATILRTADSQLYYSGPKEVALIVDTVPNTNTNARTVSFGSIGVYNGLAAKDEQTERLVLNTINYLRRTQPLQSPVTEGNQQ